MTLLGTAILFNKASNTHNQLRYITTCKPCRKKDKFERQYLETEFDALLDTMTKLFNLSDTEENRFKLQEFLLRYADKIYNESQRCEIVEQEQISREKDIYELKH